MDTTYRKNLKAVLTASKDYTDKTKEEIYWHIGDYSISTQPDNTTASTKTVPSGATRCKIKRIYGLTEKFNPSVAYDNASTMTKTMPNVVYDFDCSVVYGNSEVSENQIVLPDTPETTTNGITWKIQNGIIYLNGTNTSSSTIYISINQTTRVENGQTYYFYIDGIVTGISVIYLSNRGDWAAEPTFYNKNNNYKTMTASGYLKLEISVRGSATINTQLKPMLVKGTTAPTEFKQGFNGIHNLELSGLKVEGVNLANTALFELGAINVNTGEDLANNERMRSNYIIVEPSTYYTLKWDNANVNVVCYNENKVKTGSSAVAGTFLTTPDTKYVRFYSGLITTSTQIMLNEGSTALPYEPYVSQTLPIDLTSIEDSGGNKLFADGSLKGYNNVYDEISPTKAIKRRMRKIIRLSTGNVFYETQQSRFYVLLGLLNTVGSNQGGATLLNLPFTYKSYLQGDMSFILWRNYQFNSDAILFKDASTISVEAFIQKYGNTLDIDFEIVTPIEVSIDWSSTLRGIQGYANGTITLQNTYNMDTANTITYNSIIKENCCAKIVQSRGGSVVKTINLPTTASDGYSAGSASNVRDFTTNKRGTNVDKQNDLNTLNWSEFGTAFVQSTNLVSVIKKPSSNSVVANALSIRYNMVARNSADNTNDICVNSDGYVVVRNREETPNGVFYYELADASKTETDIDSVDNIIEVQPNDILSFYDSNDNLVTVPSEITYRIEVERV